MHLYIFIVNLYKLTISKLTDKLTDDYICINHINKTRE